MGRGTGTLRATTTVAQTHAHRYSRHRLRTRNSLPIRRVAHHGESKMAAQAGKSSSDRDGKNLCGTLFWETDALNK